MKKENEMVSIEIDIEDDVLFKLCLMAHEEDITLNQLITRILREYIEKLEGEEKNE